MSNTIKYERCPCCGNITESNKLNLTKESILNKIISDKRINNLKAAFPSVKWKYHTLTILALGLYNDAPQFCIEGTVIFPNIKKRISIRWYSAHPGGNSARLFYWWNKQMYKITKAALKRSPEIFKQIFDHIKEMEKRNAK